MKRSRQLRCFLLACALSIGACVAPGEDGAVPAPDRALFESQVWPVLVRDCGFSACHGSSERFFRVLGPGHVRLDPAARMSDPATPAELDLSYGRARSMIDGREPERSLLLRKPLAPAAGGAAHEGLDALGRDVYRDKNDPNYQLLLRWITGQAP